MRPRTIGGRLICKGDMLMWAVGRRCCDDVHLVVDIHDVGVLRLMDPRGRLWVSMNEHWFSIDELETQKAPDTP